jgi:hypothetical protein
MENILTPPKRRGNPNFGAPKKADTPNPIKNKLEKQYIFQLLKTHTKQKPVDSNTGELVGSPYQPWFGVVNSGMAWDPNYTPKGARNPGAQRRWRYLANYPTIWVDEQIDPEPSKEDLADPANDLLFRQGVLRVFGHQEMKLKALQLNNAFAGCERQLKNVPFEYELLDQDKIDKEVLEVLDNAFEAEKSAREASLSEMYALAYYYGIDLAGSDDAIRKQFITKARQNPTVFNREFVNPKNKYRYVFASAIADNVISGTMIPGNVVIVDSMAKVFDLKSDDMIEELSANCFIGDKKALELYNQISKEYL